MRRFRRTLCIGAVLLLAATGCARERRVADDPFLGAPKESERTASTPLGSPRGTPPAPRTHTTINVAEAAEGRAADAPPNRTWTAPRRSERLANKPTPGGTFPPEDDIDAPPVAQPKPRPKPRATSLADIGAAESDNPFAGRDEVPRPAPRSSAPPFPMEEPAPPTARGAVRTADVGNPFESETPFAASPEPRTPAGTIRPAGATVDRTSRSRADAEVNPFENLGETAESAPAEDAAGSVNLSDNWIQTAPRPTMPAQRGVERSPSKVRPARTPGTKPAAESDSFAVPKPAWKSESGTGGTAGAWKATRP